LFKSASRQFDLVAATIADFRKGRSSDQTYSTNDKPPAIAANDTLNGRLSGRARPQHRRRIVAECAAPERESGVREMCKRDKK
jgi:hypothetical protein